MTVLGLSAPPLRWHNPSDALVAADSSVLTLVDEERVPVASLREALTSADVPPVLINIFFNWRREPIVDDPGAAHNAFAQMQLRHTVFHDKLLVSRHD